MHTATTPTLIAASVALLLTSAAQAMEIRQFDKMSIKDQADYINALVVGAQKVSIDDGKGDLADKIHKLFTTTLAGDQMTLGMVEFTSNLDRARLADAENFAKDHNAPRIEVEDAMAVTLDKNHISLPDSFFTVLKDFKPKHPPGEKTN